MEITCTNCGTSNQSNHKYCKNCGFELPKVEVGVEEPVAKPLVKEKKKINVKGLIGVVFGILTFYAVQHFFFKPPGFDKVMMQVASEINKTCPVMIDAETRLDNTIALPENIFVYNYTLINAEKATMDTLTIKNLMEPNIVNFVRTNPDMKITRDYKSTIKYLYKDKNGEYLFAVSVTPDQYE
jgi:hypothetical protein